MRKMIKSAMRKAAVMVREQRGITGLETAIVLIAFVVVSSVFAFAALSTGLFSSDQAKNTIQAGLKEAQGTLELKGSVIADATTTDVPLGAWDTGDGATVAFDLANGPVIPGSLVVKVAGVTKTEGTDYSVDYTANPAVVTFTVAPANLAALTASFTYYTVDNVVFQISNSAGGRAVDLTPGKTILSYQDGDNLDSAISDYGLTWLGSNNSNNLLETGEIAQITVDVSGYNLYSGKDFTVQVKPQAGATVNIGRTMIANITASMDLN